MSTKSAVGRKLELSQPIYLVSEIDGDCIILMSCLILMGCRNDNLER
jgi:hypothetical protein